MLFSYVLQFHILYFLAFGVIIIGIVIYTVHLPKTAAESELNSADNERLSCCREPVTLVSVTYQNGGSVTNSAAIETQVTVHDTDDAPSNQLMSVSNMAAQSSASEC